MPSTAGSRPAVGVTASSSALPLSSGANQSSSTEGAARSGVNMWLSREADEQLRQAVEVSELLTTSTSIVNRL